MMTVGEYLETNGYRNVAEWALDSDYEYREELDIWLDEWGNIVDPRQQLIAAIESAAEPVHRYDGDVSKKRQREKKCSQMD